MGANEKHVLKGKGSLWVSPSMSQANVIGSLQAIHFQALLCSLVALKNNQEQRHFETQCAHPEEPELCPIPKNKAFT